MESKNNTIIDIKDLKKIGQLLRDNWLIIFSFVLLSTIAAYLYSYKLPKIYAAKTQLLLKSQETYSYQEGLYKGLGMYTGYEKMANQKRVLTSTDLVSRTISKLKMDVSYYIVGRLQTKEVFTGTPFLVEAQIYHPNFYEFPFTLKILDEATCEISYETEGKQEIIKHHFGEPIITNNFYLLVDKTNALNKSTVASFKDITYQFSVHDRNNLIYSYKNALTAENLEWTAILEVTLENENPGRAIEFLDTLSKEYIANSLKTQIRVNENTIVDIDRQLNGVGSILDSIEDMMENYKESKSILNLSKEETTYYENLTNHEITKRKIELQLKNLVYLKNYITSNMNKELLPPSPYIDDEDAYLKSAITKLYSCQVQINGMLFTTTEKSTSVKELEYQIELLRNDILKYLVNLEKALNEKSQSIDGEILYYEGMLKGVPRDQRQILNISRKMQVNEKLYSYLLQKRAETVIARSGIFSETSVIESAHSIGIVKPDMQKIYYSFISGGLLFAFIIALIRTLFFGRINNMDELRDLTNFSVLGEIYYAKEAKDSYLVVDAEPRSFITESFRAIRTNLEYMAPGTKSKIILITSNRPGVGKTFCSVNTGAILAKGGKKVLIIELDLHKPKIQTALSISSDFGMTTLLIGKSTPEDSITKTSIENLDVILAGPAPPNASELLLSNHLPPLLQHAKKNYDYIIIDTPPMGIISDAQVLMKYSDVNLFILNTKQGPREGLHFAHNAVANNKIDGFGFIINNVKQRYSRYYYKGYKYTYGYGYANEKVNS